MAYTQILYQIIYSTKHREATMLPDGREQLFRHMWGVLKNKRCHLYRLNGIEDHLHIITHLHPSVALADLVRDLKLSSWDLIKREPIFPGFGGWQEAYSAFTYHIEAKDALIGYVKNQEAHHKQESYLDELRRLYIEHRIPFEERYLE